MSTANIPTADELKSLARGFVTIARQQNLARLVAELELNGTRVEVLIERITVRRRTDDLTEGADDIAELEELVTVKAGAKSRPKTLVAAPADWVMP
jgi:hypothetical protein